MAEEVGGLQRRAADQAAVDVGLGQQLGRVVAASRCRRTGCSCWRRARWRRAAARAAARAPPAPVGRGRLAGADGPHRLVGDHDLADAMRRCTWITAASWRLTTPRSRRLRAAASVSPTQTIGVSPAPARPCALSATSCVALAMILAALGVADDDVAAAEIHQHRRRHLAGEGALRVRRESCAPSAMACRPAAICTAPSTAPARRPQRRRPACRMPAQGVQQRVVGSQAAIHLPVAGDQLPSGHRHLVLVHQVSTILPMCWFDSIRAWACARPGSPMAAKVLVHDRFDRAAFQQRPHLARSACAMARLEGDRAWPQGRTRDRQAATQHRPALISALTPPCTAMITSRPSSARQSISRAT